MFLAGRRVVGVAHPRSRMGSMGRPEPSVDCRSCVQPPQHDAVGVRVRGLGAGGASIVGAVVEGPPWRWTVFAQVIQPAGVQGAT